MKPLAAILAAGVLVAWLPQAWPWYAIEAAIFSLVASRALHRRLSWLPSPWLYALTAGALWPWVQIAAGTTVYRWETYAARLTWTAWLGVFVIAESAAQRDRRERSWMLDAIALLSALVAIAAILHRGFDSQYAGFVLLTMPIALWRGEKWMLVGPALQAVSVFMAGSLPDSILVVVEALAVLSLRADELPRLRMAAAGVAIVVVLLVAPHRQENWHTRAETVRSALQMARDHPVFGAGLGTWQTAYPAYAHVDDASLDRSAQNDWAQWLAEGGVPFFLAMLLLTVGAVREGLRTGWAFGLAFALLHCLIAPDFDERPIFGAVFFTIASLTRGLGNY